MKKDEQIKKLEKQVRRLKRDCMEAYQVIGAAMLGDKKDCTPFTQDDVERALDNLAAAFNGKRRPHKDLLPWPK